MPSLIGGGGDTLFFTTDAYPATLWRSDGTEEGTFVVHDIAPFLIDERWIRGDLVFYSVEKFCTVTGKCPPVGELWRSDGTPEGTFPLPPLVGREAGFVELDGALFFASGTELWTTDGSAEGTRHVADLPPQYRRLGAGDGLLFFAGEDGKGFELWKSDGTEEGTVPVADLRLPARSSEPVRSLFDFDGTLLFRGDESTVGGPPAAADFDLWTSDGTHAGTQPLHVGLPGGFAQAGNAAFFSMDDGGPAGRELWKTDATVAGTRIVRDVWPGSGPFGPNASDPFGLVALGDLLLFYAEDGTGAELQLWRSDGSEAGTTRVRDLEGRISSRLVVVGDVALFAAYDSTHGRELWKTDGTAAGTVLVKDIAPGSASSLPQMVSERDGVLLFLARESEEGPLGIWRTDGTAAGTVLLFTPPSDFSGNVTVVDGDVFFTAGSFSLWTSDGTQEGMFRVVQIPPPPGHVGAGLSELTAAGGLLFFLRGVSVDFATRRTELWKSDGSEAGTTRVMGPLGTDPVGLTEVGGLAVFSANGGEGEEFWASDGTAAGTRLVADVAQPGGSSPTLMTPSGDLVYFSAVDDSVGRALFAVPRTAITDADGDGVELLDERALGSDPNDPHSDADGLDDGEEVALGTSPILDDSDADGLTDGDEVRVHGTDPVAADSDSDGWSDGFEVAAGTDPKDPKGLFFDFEDGLQGWQLLAGAERVETDALGGAWAIEGADGDAVQRALDLTGVEALVVDTLFLGESPELAPDMIAATVLALDEDGQANGDGGAVWARNLSGRGVALSPDADPFRLDLSTYEGPHLVALHWNELPCPVEPCGGPDFPGLIDDVRFIPEPGALTLAIAALATLAALPRRRRESICLR